jgi:hypothetical protein
MALDPEFRQAVEAKLAKTFAAQRGNWDAYFAAHAQATGLPSSAKPSQGFADEAQRRLADARMEAAELLDAVEADLAQTDPEAEEAYFQAHARATAIPRPE